MSFAAIVVAPLTATLTLLFEVPSFTALTLNNAIALVPVVTVTAGPAVVKSVKLADEVPCVVLII